MDEFTYLDATMIYTNLNQPRIHVVTYLSVRKVKTQRAILKSGNGSF